MARKKNKTAAPASALAPYDVSGPLPDWSPSAPAGGWTPSAAWDASLDYADEHGSSTGLAERRLAKCAFRALLASTPGLHCAYTVERLSGVDVARESEPAPF